LHQPELRVLPFHRVVRSGDEESRADLSAAGIAGATLWLRGRDATPVVRELREHFERVRAVRARNVRHDEPETVLSLLAVTFREDTSVTLVRTYALEAIRRICAIMGALQDQGEPEERIHGQRFDREIDGALSDVFG